uniref:Uncharacterized protein n=1 Tax=Glossina pallidipes TaxID=7398 RepID=A0A1B0AHA8_GLOPL
MCMEKKGGQTHAFFRIPGVVQVLTANQAILYPYQDVIGMNVNPSKYEGMNNNKNNNNNNPYIHIV